VVLPRDGRRVCVFWIASGAGLQVAHGTGLFSTIFLTVVTILLYLGYRRLRGWKAIPPRRQPGVPPSRNGLGALVFVTPVIVFAGFVSPLVPKSPSSGQDTPWTKGLAGTTCRDWKSVMTSQQRRPFAEAELADARANARTQAARENLATITVESYTRITDDMCAEEAPNLPVSWSTDYSQYP
jgi:hypothetical protein